jgi:virulence-associated protein VapD
MQSGIVPKEEIKMANKNFDTMSMAMAKEVETVKNAGGVPYVGISFDLVKRIAKPANAWGIISKIADEYGFEHPQQSLYILRATPATEESALKVMERFLNRIQRQKWAKDGIKSAHVIGYRNMYDVTACYKEDVPISIGSLEMEDDFKLRRAAAGAYEKLFKTCASDKQAIIHDNAPHYGIIFDLHGEDNQAMLKAIYGEDRFLKAYSIIRMIMKKNGFFRSHGSAYVCSKVAACTEEGMKRANDALTDLYYEENFSDLVKNIKVVEFYRTYDVTFLLRDKKVGAFRKVLKKNIEKTKNGEID